MGFLVHNSHLEGLTSRFCFASLSLFMSFTRHLFRWCTGMPGFLAIDLSNNLIASIIDNVDSMISYKVGML
jgi:hypothetical protein